MLVITLPFGEGGATELAVKALKSAVLPLTLIKPLVAAATPTDISE
jgi:hypothetical protein